MSGKFRKWVTMNQVLAVGLAIVLEALWLVGLLTRFSQYASWLSAGMRLLSLLIVVALIRFEQKPELKMLWLTLIILMPILGGTLYILLGGGHPYSRPLYRRLKESESVYESQLQQDPDTLARLGQAAPSFLRKAYFLSSTQHAPVYDHTDAHFFPLGEEAWKAMLEDLKQAKHYIFLEYFIVEEGKMWDAMHAVLVQKAAEGVEIRFLYDDVGSLGTVPRSYWRRLSAEGIHCYAFNRFIPFLSIMMNNRDHRKILSIDGRVGYMGGINLADEYINEKVIHGHWKDTAVRLEGRAVWSLTVMFLQMWRAVADVKEDFSAFRPQEASCPEGTGFVQPYYDSPLDQVATGAEVYLNIIDQAAEEVSIYTPYLIIDSEMMTSLQRAARRGVRVRIVTPGIPDKKIVFSLTRSYYAPLISAGVEIYEYTPGFVHAKVFESDGRVATVGSINMDYRSLLHHFECGTLLYDCSCIAAIRSDFEETVSRSRRITAQECSWGLLKNCWLALLQIVSPLF